jgi:prepilin-type N-terminal cleavage/methylation domain-containing protein
MIKEIRAARENESGFTLIELLIVIVILGVLAGIVVFAVGGINDTSKASACKSDVKNVEIAQEAFYAQSLAPKAYAASVGALVTAKLLREPPDAAEVIATDTTGVVTHTCTF